MLTGGCARIQVHQLVEEADVVREGWNGYNVFHDTASRVAALDVGFLPSARASSAPASKFVYLLGSDDYREEDIPQDAFVVYQVQTAFMAAQSPLLCEVQSCPAFSWLILGWETLCCILCLVHYCYNRQPHTWIFSRLSAEH